MQNEFVFFSNVHCFSIVLYPVWKDEGMNSVFPKLRLEFFFHEIGILLKQIKIFPCQCGMIRKN